MTKKFLALLIGLMMPVAFFAGISFAAEATRVYIEADNKAPAVFGDEMRCRLVILDANGELATTFGGSDIADATIDLQSLNNGNKVLFSTKTASDLDLTGDFESAAEKVTINVSDAWQEFAVNFDSVKEVGSDTIRATLKKGSSAITANLNITVMAPLANTLVTVTGGVGSLPDILDKCPTAQADKGATKVAGDSTTVDVFAAFYNSDDGLFYYTDNVPGGMENITVLGTRGRTSGFEAGYIVASETLTDGHVSTSVAVQDLKIPEYIANRVQAGWWNTAALQMGAMSSILCNGLTITWSASAYYTREVGSANGDVNSDEEISVSLFDREKYYRSPASMASRTDTSKYVAGSVDLVTIIGIPVNDVTSVGNDRLVGFTGENADFEISPLDGYFLTPDPMKKPSGSAFKVAGDVDASTRIYGAVVAYDRYDNPAPFDDSDARNDTEIFLKKKNIAGTDTEAINATITDELVSAYYTTTTGHDNITNTYSCQAFYPFYMPAQSDTGTYASITRCYIDKIEVDSSELTDEDPWENTVGSDSLGVSFFAQDYIASITETIAADITKAMDDDTEIQLEGRGTEKSYAMNVVGPDGSAMQIGPEDSTSGSSPVAILNDSDELAKSKAVWFTSAANGEKMFCVFKGADANTYAVRPVTVTATNGIAAVDGGDAEPSYVSSNVKTVNAILDGEENHNIITIDGSDGTLVVQDAFGNSFKAANGNKSIEDAELTGSVLVSSDNADTVVPAHTVDFDGDKVKIEFDLGSIGEDDGAYKVMLETDQGNVSRTFDVNVRAMKSLNLDNIFVAVPGVTDTPIVYNFADQAGDLIKPVTITGITTTAGASYDVEFEVDNGTLSGVSTTTASQLTTAGPKDVFTAKPSSGKITMEITADPDVSGLDKAVLSLVFIPDFDPPVVGTPTGINCGISIPITDNQAVDTANCDVTVKNSDGEDITATLTRTNTDSGTTGTITMVSSTPLTGTFTVEVTAVDLVGNVSDPTTKTVSVTECTIEPPTCLDVDPTFALLGETERVTISGDKTSFVDGSTTVSFGCSGITVDSTTVNSATEVVVNITVAADATEETCDVTVTTGSETITCEDAFEVTAVPLCIDADGDGYGENCALGADCDDTDAAVNPGATEVCDDGIDNDCDGDIDSADSACGGECEIVSLSPSSVRTFLGFIPRVIPIIVTGNSAADFTGITADDVSFVGGARGIIRVLSVSPGTDTTTATVTVLFWRASRGDYDVSIGDCSGGTFTVE